MVLFEDGLDYAVVDVDVLVVAWGLETVGLEFLVDVVQGDVYYGPDAWADALVSDIAELGARVEGAPVVSVDGQ